MMLNEGVFAVTGRWGGVGNGLEQRLLVLAMELSCVVATVV